MNAVLKKYYEKNKVPGMLLEKKMAKFDNNPDIASEFAYWIENKEYKTDGALCIEGHTAKSLSEVSQYLEGEGAFMMLIELRENPERALSQIAKGFKRK